MIISNLLIIFKFVMIFEHRGSYLVVIIAILFASLPVHVSAIEFVFEFKFQVAQYFHQLLD